MKINHRFARTPRHAQGHCGPVHINLQLLSNLFCDKGFFDKSAAGLTISICLEEFPPFPKGVISAIFVGCASEIYIESEKAVDNLWHTRCCCLCSPAQAVMKGNILFRYIYSLHHGGNKRYM